MMEVGDADSVLQNPKHPYTQTLLTAVPRVDPRNERERVRIPGEVKERINGSVGCPFKDRCEYRFDKCDEELELVDPGGDASQQVACHLYDEDVDRPLPVYER